MLSICMWTLCDFHRRTTFILHFLIFWIWPGTASAYQFLCEVLTVFQLWYFLHCELCLLCSDQFLQQFEVHSLICYLSLNCFLQSFQSWDAENLARVWLGHRWHLGHEVFDHLVSVASLLFFGRRLHLLVLDFHNYYYKASAIAWLHLSWVKYLSFDKHCIYPVLMLTRQVHLDTSLLPLYFYVEIEAWW